MSESAQSVNYEEFERLHVVRRLRQIVGNWWKVQLNFTDARGFLRGVPQGKFFNPTNKVCAFITGQDGGFKDCVGTARTTTFENVGSQGAKLGHCHAGFSTLTLPLRIEGKYLGAIFADGFLFESTSLEQKEKLKKYLAHKFPNDAQGLHAHIEDLPVLNQRDIEYLTELLEVVIEEVVTLRKTIADSAERLQVMSKELSEKWDFGKMVGKSPAMLALFKLLGRVADSDATILVTGENGTGKEGIARALHYNSKRKKNSFVIQNCGALNDNLLESELFGHVKGAFTSAVKDKKGLFELADKGTLFLDEIGDTSPAMQVKLLRVLQEGTFIPVGGTEQRRVDVRIVAATNRNLEQMVKEGTFREDLYYRLNVINIKVPPLRDRKEDIPLLVSRFLDDYTQTAGIPKKRVSRDCLERMERHDWPGNVRELQNEVERLCVLAGDLPEISSEFVSERIGAKKDEKFPGLRVEGKLKDAIEELERKMIFDCLIRENWNKSRVAKLLGISRAGLIMKCEKFGFDKTDDYKRAAG
jgi:two-component system, NtrC family, response regulator HupR/HoxA